MTALKKKPIQQYTITKNRRKARKIPNIFGNNDGLMIKFQIILSKQKNNNKIWNSLHVKCQDIKNEMKIPKLNAIIY
jgi:hypothetical protein